MFRFVGIPILWLRQTGGHAAAVGALVGQQEFRNVEDVIRGKQLVESRLREVESVMALEPRAQLRRNLEVIDKPIARRDGVFLLYFLDDLRVALGEDVKRELAHGLRARSRWRDAGDDFEGAGVRLRACPAHKGKAAQRNAVAKNGCFSHAGIVADCGEVWPGKACFVFGLAAGRISSPEEKWQQERGGTNKQPNSAGVLVT